mmetsp:Transcript_39927/g.89501  ORF Transcript_39927/g.89501 Transcript_39927/m.89501 type:complete len:208 (-) Transcript_39927:629-1252(-)
MLRLGGVGGLGEPRGRHGSDVALVHVRVRRCRPKLLPEDLELVHPVAALVELIGHHAAAVHDVHLDLGLVVVIGRRGLVRVQPLLQWRPVQAIAVLLRLDPPPAGRRVHHGPANLDCALHGVVPQAEDAHHRTDLPILLRAHRDDRCCSGPEGIHVDVRAPPLGGHDAGEEALRRPDHLVDGRIVCRVRPRLEVGRHGHAHSGPREE